MSNIQKSKWILSVIARGRKLKGNKTGIFFTIPYRTAENLNISAGDMLELEIRKISKIPIRNETNPLQEVTPSNA